jgi:hypothetical protein
VFLIDRADPRRFWQQDLAAQRHQIAEDDLEQRRLADAIPPDQANLGSGRNRHVRRIKEAPAPSVKHEIVDPKHGAGARSSNVLGRF